MMDKSQQLLDILEQAKSELSGVKSIHELNNIKSKFIGKKSQVNDFLKVLGTLSKEEKPAFGKLINDTKVAIEQLVAEAESRIDDDIYEHAIAGSQIDYTMPARPYLKGALHHITIIQHQIEDVLIQMGFQVAEGFDIEDEFHNFDALNTPKDHPARNLADTFYIRDDILLRTHTSTAQIRVMKEYRPPIKMISTGRCYRNDKFDATHSPVFHQIEGLYVDEGVSFHDLRTTLTTFAKKMFGSETKTRFRPHFFPFTEPSAELDVTCFMCRGKGCATCKQSGWIEVGGAGMVDPHVFDMLGIDSEKYTGFAFGCGIDRMTMIKFRVPDIRLLYDNYIV
jgi:phenylalanyl-tRNA synthetase alpha chain